MYFSSEWCRLELANMFVREQTCGLRTETQPNGLILPAAIHDGERFPLEARAIQQAQLQTYANTRIAPDSPSEERLSEQIRTWTPDVAQAIQNCPEYDAAWVDLSVEDFLSLFTAQDIQQREPPRLGEV
jgi:hypothetical protein